MVTWSTVSSTSPASLESKLAPRFIYVGQKVDKGDRKQEVGPKSSDMQSRKRKMKVFIFYFVSLLSKRGLYMLLYLILCKSLYEQGRLQNFSGSWQSGVGGWDEGVGRKRKSE